MAQNRPKNLLWIVAIVAAIAAFRYFKDNFDFVQRGADPRPDDTSSAPSGGETAGPPVVLPRTGTSGSVTAEAEEGAPVSRPSPGPATDSSPSTEASTPSVTVNSRPRVDAQAGEARILRAFRDEERDVMVEGAGTIVRTLADDNEGSRHQKWILRLSGGHTLLFAHNIDVAPRVPLDRGDEIEFRGEYVHSDQGGVIHFTHRPQYGDREGGWIRHDDKIYE